jgi:hypothetical protein
MSKFKKFGEFFSTRKKKDDIDAKDGLAGEDYDGPLAVKPEQEPTKGKSDKALPYKADGEEKKGVVWTAPDDGSKKGLAHHSTPGITPQTSTLGKAVEDKTQSRPKPKKMTTEQFIETTKEMTDSEFANYILESHGNREISTVTDLFGNEFTPDPTQTIEYVTSLMMGNPYYMEKFIREMKRRGAVGELMSELFNHGESYDLVVDHLEDPEFGLDRTGKLARMLNERFMKHYENFDFGDGDEDGEQEDTHTESVAPSLDAIMPQQKKVQGGPMGGGSGPDMTPNPNYADKSVFSSDGGKTSNPMGAQSMRNPSGGSPLGGQQNPQFGNQPVMPPQPVMMKKMKEGSEPKFKGKSAGIHLINELSVYPAFKRHMLDRCMGGDCQ